jgi:hypothetical protein
MIIALVGDNIDELLLTKTITEKSPAGTMAGARFLYQKDKRYGGEIQYKIYTGTDYNFPMAQISY